MLSLCVFDCSTAAEMRSRPFTSHQRFALKSASPPRPASACAATLTQPFRPYASTIAPTSTTSSGQVSADSTRICAASASAPDTLLAAGLRAAGCRTNAPNDACVRAASFARPEPPDSRSDINQPRERRQRQQLVQTKAAHLACRAICSDAWQMRALSSRSRTSQAVRPQPPLSSRLRLLRLLHKTLDGRRQLRANALPVREAVLSDTQRLTLRSDRVVETNAFDKAAVTTVTRIGCDDVVERALLRAATSQADDDHTKILENRGSEPLKHAIIAGNRSHNKHLPEKLEARVVRYRRSPLIRGPENSLQIAPKGP